MRKKIICELDESNMVYTGIYYIGTITGTAEIVEYTEPKNDAQLTLEFIKAGVSPEDIIKLRHNDLV